MIEMTKYRVLDVRETNKVEWSIRTNTAYNIHYYVFILENVTTGQRIRWSTEDKIIRHSSEHNTVVAGDTILLVEERNFFADTEYRITIE